MFNMRSVLPAVWLLGMATLPRAKGRSLGGNSCGVEGCSPTASDEGASLSPGAESVEEIAEFEDGIHASVSMLQMQHQVMLDQNMQVQTRSFVAQVPVVAATTPIPGNFTFVWTTPKPPTLLEKWLFSLVNNFFSWVVWVSLGAVSSKYFYYRGTKPKKDPSTTVDPADTFESGHCQCCNDPYNCLCSLFCTCIRWPDTVYTAGLSTGFCRPFLGFVVCAFLNMALWCGWYGLGVITALYMTYYRQLLREKLDLSPWTCWAMSFDCIWLLICPCLAIAQDNKVVKDAFEAGHENFV